MKLVPGAELYNQWLDPPLPIFMTFYLFDLKNGPEFIKGEKPKFEEIGPFVFREYITKENIVDNLNYTISYSERRRYVFQRDMSPYELDYEITSLNLAVVTVLSQIKYSADWIHDAVNAALTVAGENSILVRKPVRELLFGYEDDFLKQLKKIVPSLVPTDIVGLFTNVFPSFFSHVILFLHIICKRMPPLFQRNDTIYANFTIYTGVDDYKKVGAIERYNHME